MLYFCGMVEDYRAEEAVSEKRTSLKSSNLLKLNTFEVSEHHIVQSASVLSPTWCAKEDLDYEMFLV